MWLLGYDCCDQPSILIVKLGGFSNYHHELNTFLQPSKGYLKKVCAHVREKRDAGMQGNREETQVCGGDDDDDDADGRQRQ